VSKIASNIVRTSTVFLLLACALLVTGCSKPTAAKKNRKAAPEFSLKDANGQTVHLSDYKGKVVLLDFWATWCGPCKVEIPWFMEFETQFKGQGFAVLGVSMDEDGWAAIKPYVRDRKMNYRVLLGNDQVSTSYGGLDALPTTLLIDRQGDIASVHEGVSMGKEEFKNAIVQLLGSPSVSAPAAARRVLALLRSPGSR
jgi:cytochrome c biogenesis protein CcmG/thiol:disulfide interchange protein DsbE